MALNRIQKVDDGAPKASWRARLGVSAVFAVMGLVFVVGAGAVLVWSEGRAVQTARSLAEAGTTIVSIEADRIDPANEGRLVHLSGPVETAGTVADPEFGVTATALRLVRTAEMYQWEENEHTDPDDRYTTYSYSKDWSDRPINSGGFQRRLGHENPPKLIGDFEALDEQARLGAFRPGPAVLRQLEPTEALALDPTIARAAGERLGRPVVLDGSRLYLGQDADSPEIGDYRISYAIAPAGPVSIIGRQAGEGVAAYQTAAGDPLLLVEPGLVSAADMLGSAQSKSAVLSWVLRLVGLAAMALGFLLLMQPAAAASSAVPALGRLVRGGTRFTALTATALVGPAIIALAWVGQRPATSAVFLAGGLAAAFAVRRLAIRRATAGASVAAQ